MTSACRYFWSSRRVSAQRTKKSGAKVLLFNEMSDCKNAAAL